MESLWKEMMERFYRGESLISTLAWVRSALEHLYPLKGWAFLMDSADLREEVAAIPQQDVPISVVMRLRDTEYPEMVVEEDVKYLLLPVKSGKLRLGNAVLVFAPGELPDPEHWVPFASLLFLFLARNLLQALQEKGGVVDPLTGLYTRSYLHRRLEEERKRSLRGQTVFSVGLVDIDHFQSVVRSHGPFVGDELLVALSELLRGHFRSTDIIFRYENDRFAILFSDTSPSNAFHALESFRRLVEENQFELENLEEPIRITVSGAIVGFPSHGLTVQELLEEVERALQDAKKAGGNRVVVPEVSL